MIIFIEIFFCCKMAYNCAGLALWSQHRGMGIGMALCVCVCIRGCSLTPASNMASFSPLEAGPKVSKARGERGRAQN